MSYIKSLEKRLKIKALLIVYYQITYVYRKLVFVFLIIRIKTRLVLGE